VRLCQGYLFARPALERLPAPTAGVIAAIHAMRSVEAQDPSDSPLGPARVR
jgi:hypothetical protein